MIKYRNFLRKIQCNGICEARQNQNNNKPPSTNTVSIHACTQCASHNRHKQLACVLMHENVSVARERMRVYVCMASQQKPDYVCVARQRMHRTVFLAR